MLVILMALDTFNTNETGHVIVCDGWQTSWMTAASPAMGSTMHIPGLTRL